jgi:hypothetical protein
MVIACIVLLYISYAIPIICLLIKGRNNIPHGPFWMGPIGLFSNYVLLAWTLFTFIMYSFPSVQPVLPNSKSSPFLHYYAVFWSVLWSNLSIANQVMYFPHKKTHDFIATLYLNPHTLTPAKTVLTPLPRYELRLRCLRRRCPHHRSRLVCPRPQTLPRPRKTSRRCRNPGSSYCRSTLNVKFRDGRIYGAS